MSRKKAIMLRRKIRLFFLVVELAVTIFISTDMTVYAAKITGPSYNLPGDQMTKCIWNIGTLDKSTSIRYRYSGNTKLTVGNTGLKNSGTYANSDTAALLKEIEELKSENASLVSANKSLTSQVATLTEKYEALQESALNTSDLTDQIATLIVSNEELSETVTSLKTANNELMSENKKLTTSRDNYKSKYNSTKETNTSLKEMNTSLQKENTSLKSQVSALESQVTSLNGTNENLTNRITSEARSSTVSSSSGTTGTVTGSSKSTSDAVTGNVNSSGSNSTKPAAGVVAGNSTSTVTTGSLSGISENTGNKTESSAIDSKSLEMMDSDIGTESDEMTESAVTGNLDDEDMEETIEEKAVPSALAISDNVIETKSNDKAGTSTSNTGVILAITVVIVILCGISGGAYLFIRKRNNDLFEDEEDYEEY